jgi:hypothetical protein
LQKRQEVREPNHPKDVIGSHRGISVDSLLVQPIWSKWYYKKIMARLSIVAIVVFVVITIVVIVVIVVFVIILVNIIVGVVIS